MKPNSAQIIYEPSIDVYKIEFGMIFHKQTRETFYSVLKTTVPPSDRSYDPKTHIWMIQTKWYTIVKMLIDATYTQVYTYTKEQYEDSVRGQTAATQITPSEYKNRFNTILRELGEVALIKDDTSYSDAAKIYRRLAMKLHPDRNPNGAEYMSRINECWASIKIDYQRKEQLTSC